MERGWRGIDAYDRRKKFGMKRERRDRRIDLLQRKVRGISLIMNLPDS